MLFYCNNGCKNVPQCCVICSWPVLFFYGNSFFCSRPFDVCHVFGGTQLVRKTRLWRACYRMGDSGAWPANIRTIQLCMFSSFFPYDVSLYHNNVPDNSGLVGCDAVLFGERYPRFCSTVFPSFSRAQQSKKGTYWNAAPLKMKPWPPNLLNMPNLTKDEHIIQNIDHIKIYGVY
jgi:hypothetical protein